MGKQKQPAPAALEMFSTLSEAVELMREAIITSAFSEANLTDIEKLSNAEINRAANTVIKKINENLTQHHLSIGKLNNMATQFNKELLLAGQDFHKRVVAPTIKTVNEITSQLSVIYSKWAKEHSHIIEDSTKVFKSIFDENDKEFIRIAEFFASHKWATPLDAPLSVLQDIRQKTLESRQPRSTLSKLMIEYFESPEGEKVWCSSGLTRPHAFIQKERIKIIRDCEEAIRMKSRRINFANLVIPTLIAQIDGIKFEYMLHKGFRPEGFKFIDESNNIVKWEEEIQSGLDPDDDPIDGLVVDIFFNTLFQSVMPSDTLPTWHHWNRHKIMHGQSFRYGRKDNAYRSFLLINYFFHLQ